MPKTKSNTKKILAGGFIKFVASILFLYILISGINSGIWGTYVIGTPWIPVLISMGILGTIALLFCSTMEIARGRQTVGWKLVYVVSFAAIGLTASTTLSAGFWISVMAFVVAWLGTLVQS